MWSLANYIHFTLLTEKKLYARVAAAAAAKEIKNQEKNWLRRFKKGDISLKEKPRSGRPSVLEDEVLLEMVEQKPSTNIWTLSAEFGPLKSTINRHLHKLGLVNRRWNSLEYCKTFDSPEYNDSLLEYLKIFGTILLFQAILWRRGISAAGCQNHFILIIRAQNLKESVYIIFLKKIQKWDEIIEDFLKHPF